MSLCFKNLISRSMYIKRILLTVLVMGLFLGGVFAWFVYTNLLSPNTAFKEAEMYVYIPSNTGFEEVVEKVKPLLKNTKSFRRVAAQKKYDENVRSGRYKIIKGMNNNDIVNSLRSNNIPVNVTFNNQETIHDLAGRVSGQIEADSISLVKAMKDPVFLRENQLNEDAALALYMPNRYEFFWDTDAEEFRSRMLREYQKFWNEERKQKAAALGLSETEVISLAAIVQKETAKVDERPRVAGVYLNRIKKGMLLQADPTVIYAIKKTTGNFDTVIKRVLYRDLELDTPYNTYKYRGIPPGPITMPDISSVDAVLNPEKHNYYYFVADVENFGYHMFAQTLAQHNRNKQQYIRWVNANKINR